MLLASRAVTAIAGAIDAPDVALLGCWVKARCVAVPAAMSNAELVAPVTPVADVLRVYPVPALSIDTPEKVATPETGVVAAPPVKVPPPALFVIASEI